jgi:hypothetical protein
MSSRGPSKAERIRNRRERRAVKKGRAPASSTSTVSERERKGCHEKVAFATQAEANLVADSWGGRVRPYHCEFCGDWHMTSA